MPATPQTKPDSAAPTANDEKTYTPVWLRVMAAWGWRLLVVCAVIALLWMIGAKMSQLVIPLLMALLITSGLSPLTTALQKRGMPRWAGSLISMLLLVVVVLGLLTVVGAQIATQWPQLTEAATKGFSDLVVWLGTGPLQISDTQVDAWLDQGLKALQESRNQIASGLATFGGRIGAFFAGLATCLFAAFFFLKDGRQIAGSFEKLLPAYAQTAVEPAVRGGWTSLASYVRAAVTVAAIDGIGAGLGALILGSNLWLAITAFTFVCSFVPLLGATIAGAVATVVVLVTLGPVKAAIMLVIFVAVMSIESNVLQPILLGRAVEIHPLTVLLGIAAGAIIAGIAGALFAIPAVAFVTGAVRGAEGIFAREEPLKPGWRRRPPRAEHEEESGDTPERQGSWFRLPKRASKLDS